MYLAGRAIVHLSLPSQLTTSSTNISNQHHTTQYNLWPLELGWPMVINNKPKTYDKLIILDPNIPEAHRHLPLHWSQHARPMKLLYGW